jgi:hypothetical protein
LPILRRQAAQIAVRAPPPVVERLVHNPAVQPSTPAGLELRVLGPLRLLRDGRPLALATRKTLALLLVLVLDGNASRPRLCELLWPGLDEPAARRNPAAHAAAALELAQAVGGSSAAGRVQALVASLADWPALQHEFAARCKG